jgi:hypothetical protein
VNIARRAVALVTIGVLVAALTGCASPKPHSTWLYLDPTQSPEPPPWSTHYPEVVPGRIPYVTGLTVERARQRLAKAGFTSTKIIGSTPHTETTLVMTVIPREGTKHHTSTVIQLFGEDFHGEYKYPTPGP